MAGLVIAFFILVDYFTTGITKSLRLTYSSTINATEPQREYDVRYNEDMVDGVMQGLPGFRSAVHSCPSLVGKHIAFSAYDKARRWKFDTDAFYKDLFSQSEDKCSTIRKRFAFFDEPLSVEERDYALAYGFLVYDNAIQIYFLLSAIYQPQNAYCIAVDSKSSREFKNDMDLLGDCFSNVYVVQVNDVQWYKFSVVRGVWTCLRYLANLKHSWRYYQYLSGVDLPLKTNLEMVRILKKLNGTTNIDVKPIPADRIKRVRHQDWPLQLYKSSLSGLLTREGVDAMMQSEKVRSFIIFAQNLECPDEALWSTIFGNPEMLEIPSTFDAKSVLKRLQLQERNLRRHCTLATRILATENATLEEPFILHDYYISRYQVWLWPYTESANPWCHGKFTHFSCVYGLLDLRNLLTRPELIGHKFYLNVEPAGYFCLYESVRRRALDAVSQRQFRANVYTKLPLVRLAAGESADDIDFHLHDCRMAW